MSNLVKPVKIRNVLLSHADFLKYKAANQNSVIQVKVTISFQNRKTKPIDYHLVSDVVWSHMMDNFSKWTLLIE